MPMEIRKSIYKVVRKAEQPIDPENIAKKVNVGWGTALRYALELVILGEIQGVKTTKSWVFWFDPSNCSNREARKVERSRW